MVWHLPIQSVCSKKSGDNRINNSSSSDSKTPLAARFDRRLPSSLSASSRYGLSAGNSPTSAMPILDFGFWITREIALFSPIFSLPAPPNLKSKI